MITSWLLQRALDWRTYAVIALIAIVGTLTYKIERHGYNKGYGAGIDKNAGLLITANAQIAADADLYKQSLIESSKTQAEWMNKYQLEEGKANEAQIKLKTVNDSLRVSSDRLRVTTDQAAKRISLPNTAKASTIEYTTVLGQVFSECTAKYSELAVEARRNGIDEQKLIDSYPSNQ